MPQTSQQIKKLDMPGAENDRQEMPPPASRSAGTGRAFFWAFLALLALGGAVWWLLQPQETKDDLRAEAAATINDVLAETPLAGIGNALLNLPPPSPASIITPPTDPGTLAGRNISGTVSSPAGPGTGTGIFEVSPSTASESDVIGVEPPTEEDGQKTAPLPEDREVTPVYLEDLALWLTSRYQPATGRLGVTAQTLNHYGGVTLASKARGGRSGLLRYAFQPSMLDGLYRLYINRFMEDLDGAAKKRGLTAEQNRQFHMALAGKAVLWAAGLEGILGLPDLRQSLQKIDSAAQKTVETNMQLTNAVFELDELRENKASRQQIETVQLRVDGLAARYRRANEEHASARRSLVDEIRKKSGQTLDSDTLLFMAAWVERRLSMDSHGAAALANCVSLLRDLGRRCASAGSSS